MKKNLSGSIGLSEIEKDLADALDEIDSAIAAGEDDKEIISKFLEKMMASGLIEESLLSMQQPEHMLSDGTKSEWLFFVNAKTKFMDAIKNNSSTTILGLYDKDNYICSIGHTGTYIVPKKYVKHLGHD